MPTGANEPIAAGAMEPFAPVGTVQTWFFFLKKKFFIDFLLDFQERKKSQPR
jgi:hypothetical protein